MVSYCGRVCLAGLNCQLRLRALNFMRAATVRARQRDGTVLRGKLLGESSERFIQQHDAAHRTARSRCQTS